MVPDEYRRPPPGRSGPLVSAVWTDLRLPAHQAVPHKLVTALIAQLCDALTSTTTSGTETYEVFVRTVTLVNVYVVEEKRR